jgi:predicted lipid-binding transport protein (Tim44 family)
VKVAEVADLDFDGDARAAANDLSLADGRFAPDVLEVAARRAVAAWAAAVDGDDAQLSAIADASVIGEMLHPGDPSGQTRVVVRGPKIEKIMIVALDVAVEPARMALQITIHGARYIQDRDTAAVVSGSDSRATTFTEHWTMALSGDDKQPWRVARVRAPVGHS